MTDQSPLIDAQTQFSQKINFRSLAAEEVSLADALGRVSYTDISAPMDSPPYARAIVEGFLVNTAETKKADENAAVSFAISGEIKPGDESATPPNSGEGIAVSTGSLIPSGEFSIVRQWEAKIANDSFSITRPFPPGFFIEAQGCDIEKDSNVIKAGEIIDPEKIGILASLGIDKVNVACKPHVTLFASGDEVIPHTDAFKPGYIYDCNSPMLCAAITEAGGIPTMAGIQSDNFERFLTKLKQALEKSDMIVIAGGTAIGGRDFISDLIREVGELVQDGVQMKSGRPLIMGIANGKPMVCVAGHPPEALRGFRLFGSLAINCLNGHSLALPED